MDYAYHSIQFNINDYISEKDFRFSNLQEKINKDDLYIENLKEENSGITYDYGIVKDLHCTVLYGLVSENDYFYLRGSLKDFGPFDIKIKDINKFTPNDNADQKLFDVIYLEIESPILHQTHEFIKQNCKNKSSYPIYSPHITLGYVLPNTHNHLLGPCILTNTIFHIHLLYFNHREGFSLEMPLV